MLVISVSKMFRSFYGATERSGGNVVRDVPQAEIASLIGHRRILSGDCIGGSYS